VRTRWLTAVLLLSCAGPEPVPPCQSALMGRPGFPATRGFLVAENTPTTLRLTVDEVSCSREGLEAARAQSTLQTTDGQRLDATTTMRVSADDRGLELMVAVPPLPAGVASLRVFVEPSLAVLDVWLLSAVDRRGDEARTFRNQNCGSVAMTASGTVHCNEPRGARALHQPGEPLLPGVRQLLAAGDVVWTLENTSTDVPQVSRWRDRGDGGLDLLGTTTTPTTRLLSVTSRQAMSQRVVFRQAPDGGLTAEPTRLPGSSDAILLEDGAAFAMRNTTEVCEFIDGGCVRTPPSALTPTAAFAFDERRVWLPAFDAAGGRRGGGFLRSWVRPFALDATEGETLPAPQGYTLPTRRVTMVVQGTRPLVLARDDQSELVVVQDTPRGLLAERFPFGSRIEVSNGWLLLEDEQVFRAYRLGP
jgi:hypothetical protein